MCCSSLTSNSHRWVGNDRISYLVNNKHPSNWPLFIWLPAWFGKPGRQVSLNSRTFSLWFLESFSGPFSGCTHNESKTGHSYDHNRCIAEGVPASDQSSVAKLHLRVTDIGGLHQELIGSHLDPFLFLECPAFLLYPRSVFAIVRASSWPDFRPRAWAIFQVELTV